MKIWVAIIILIVLAIVGFLLVRNNYQTPEAVYCTQEVKLCPDGTYVGRSGPKCEFAACPPLGDLINYTDPTTGASYKYTRSLNLTYASHQDWPPKVQILAGEYTCTQSGNETDRAGKTEKRTIADKEFCVTTIVEGAAGSTYTQYAYEFEAEGKAAILTFSVREPQCGNYPEPNKSACMEEQASLDIDAIVGQIAESFKL